MTSVVRGRVLFLTRSAELLRRALEGSRLFSTDAELLDDVSTDEIAPAWASYFFDERLGRDCLTGLRDRSVGHGEILTGGFAALVAGANFGCGSSRETAPLALRAAGIRLVVAQSFARIFRQNADNIGLVTSTDFEVVPRLAGGYLRAFDAVGARVLDPACGACNNAAPGVSTRADEVPVSAASRNFPGRSGPGRVFLASPFVVAASALAGHIVAPDAEPTPEQS